MERDKRAGSGQWRGCHTFTDVVFDGPPRSDISLQPRNGGLKMGGTYWYYVCIQLSVHSLKKKKKGSGLYQLTEKSS